jgi:hypothetical protein
MTKMSHKLQDVDVKLKTEWLAVEADVWQVSFSKPVLDEADVRSDTPFSSIFIHFLVHETSDK